MKRSEMVQKLILPLSLIGGGLYTSNELKEQADSILKIIEEAGMVPPEIQSSIYLRSECAYAMVNEWEPEDGQRT